MMRRNDRVVGDMVKRKILKFISALILFNLISNVSMAQEKHNHFRIAKSIIATHLNVAMSSFDQKTPLAEIGNGGDQADVLKIIEITETVFRKKITDEQIKSLLGKFDRAQAHRMTAAKLAKIINQIQTK